MPYQNSIFPVKSLPILLLLSLLIASCSAAEEEQVEDRSFDSQAYVGVHVIDGRGKGILENMTIVVKDGMITGLGKKDDLVVSDQTEVLEADGKWVMPGLIDMHAHVTVLPIDSDMVVIEKYDTAASFEALETMLAFGITTLRNPAAPTADGIEIRDLVKDGSHLGPEIFTAGAALNRTKAFFGPFSATVTEEEIRQEIQVQVEQGVDYIKVYGSLKPGQIEIAIDEAHRHGKKVIGHLQNTSWTEAADLGIDFITHAAPWNGVYLDKRLQGNYRPTFSGRSFWLENVDYTDAPIQGMIASMLESHVSVDPTLIAFRTKFWGDDEAYTKSDELKFAPELVRSIWEKTTFTSHWTPEDYDRAKKQWPKLLALTKLMHDRGILLTAGSDFPNPWVIPGISLHQELALLAEAGIPNADIIKIATLNGAVALGIDERTGSIEVGKEADLLFLKANPLEDIENTRSIDFLLNNGKRYVPGDLNGNLAK